jgi:Subtilase family
MQKLFYFLLFTVIFAAPFGSATSQQAQPQTEPAPQSQRQLNADSSAGFRIEFLGREPTADWARAAGVLVDSKLVPMETVALGKGQDACDAILKILGFRSVGLSCSREMRAFIRKLNPSPAATEVNYPKLPIDGTTTWYAGFDRSQPGEADRYKKVTEAWKALKTGETSRESLVSVEFRGFQATITPPDSAETKKTLRQIERYDTNLQRFDTRVLPLSKAPLSVKPFSIDDPVGAAELCRENPKSPPLPPLPAYISLLHGSKDDLICESKCAALDRCPEIVLIDQAVASHPDIAGALVTDEGIGATPASGSPSWCPFVKFNENVHHGTHMAGLMVSSGKTTGFLGLAPTARLKVKNIGKLFEQNIPTIVKASSVGAANSSYNLIVVFASQFPAETPTLPDGELRHTNPRYVSDILNSQRLWIVAAGQGAKDELPGQEIGKHDNMSPMNLGDHTGVLVVTACEDCYSNQPTISPWANYSGTDGDGLVNIAAPGGTLAKPIPSTVTSLEDGLAHGTSQATALVGGLAAAMMSCYPLSYSSPRSLKFRLLATSMPPPNRGVTHKISAGIVDASKALLDPSVHWVTRKSNNGVQENFKDVRWCKETLTLNDGDDSGAATGIAVKTIRRIVKSPTEPDSWSLFYQLDPTGKEPTMRVGTVGTAADRSGSLLYFGQGPKTAGPSLPLDEIQDLLISVAHEATSQILPNFGGCKP